MQEPILAHPAAAPPLPSPGHQEGHPWSGGDRPPYSADNSEHIRLDSVQVQTQDVRLLFWKIDLQKEQAAILENYGLLFTLCKRLVM